MARLFFQLIIRINYLHHRVKLKSYKLGKEANHPIPAKRIMLSFDDGFEDNYIYPSLSCSG